MGYEYYNRRIEHIMNDLECDRETAERIYNDTMERTDEFADDARRYILLGK